MRRVSSKPVLIRKSLALLVFLLLAPAGSCMAQAESCGVEREVAAGALDEWSWKQLNAINEKISGERYAEARDDLREMLGRAGRDAYLRAILNQALAQVEWSLGNYSASLAYFERAVDLDTLPDTAHFTLMYQIAQLYFMQERYDEALEKLDLWFCKSPPGEVTSAAYVLQASIHARKQDYAGALDAIDRAIAMDGDPEEPWYQLKLAAHYELGQFPGAAQTLETLIARWPQRKIYWTQLSQVCLRLGQDDRALAVQALAYRNGLLDEQADLLYLSGLYSQSGIPFKAAEVLQSGLETGVVEPGRYHWTVVAEAWYAAEELEKSLLAYEMAGRLADDGDTDLGRGYILVDLERWPEALESLDRALRKGGLDERKTAEAHLLRGMAHFKLGSFEDAGSDWARAARSEKTGEAARQWINHLEAERRRGAS